MASNKRKGREVKCSMLHNAIRDRKELEEKLVRVGGRWSLVAVVVGQFSSNLTLSDPIYLTNKGSTRTRRIFFRSRLLTSDWACPKIPRKTISGPLSDWDISCRPPKN
jgi:hypothetical protein